MKIINYFSVVSFIRKSIKKIVFNSRLLKHLYVSFRTFQNKLVYSEENSYLNSDVSIVDLNNGNFMHVYNNDEKSIMYVCGSAKNDILNYLWKDVASDADIIFDIGANYGQFTLYLDSKDLKPGCRIYSFEPNELLFDALSRSLTVSEIKDRVKVIKCGLSSEIGEFKFYLNLVSSGGSSLIKDYAVNPHKGVFVKEVKVAVTTIDNFVAENDVDVLDKNIVMKIDIEGKDFYALLGAKDLIDQTKNFFVIIETTLNSALEFLQDHEDFIKRFFDTGSCAYATYANSIYRIHSVTEYMSHFEKATGSIDLVFSNNEIDILKYNSLSY